jgi:alpha-beta hydrolase superfamily lysophospholipase
MQEGSFTFTAAERAPLFVRSFLPEQGARAVVQLAHGMAEHSARYARLAQALTDRSYAVYASDHRGHGKTAAGPEQLGHFADRGGWAAVVSDQLSLLDEIGSRHPGLPLFLMGHSMGSYIARAVAWRRGEALSGLILSGTTHDRPIAYRVARLIAGVERVRVGRRGASNVISRLTFDGFNRRFANPRTGFDWLSRDADEVAKYIADPLCGFSCSAQLWWDVLGGLAEICTPRNLARMPKTLPVYVMAGELDAVNNRLAGIRKLRAALEKAGLASITVRVYPQARHELANETNRDEITSDLLAWLDERVA